ncbi:SDR family NAD(P)-dependent oxidoreductase [Halalkalibacterium ligniniphilum]|uniref:SDR family NAD(P)-dependent oxidoreductase n=1 Tax=Halalkalibacterium ligniniphilum TaxID=1134413 RepID=UPI00034AEC06|nr:3-oxoacyl-ACP reductase family protein [Halalkalibacterium ligniniphilum]
MSLDLETSLKEKVVLITGGTKGIGRECANELAKYGAKLAIAARNQSHLDTTVEELKMLGAEVVGVQTDVSSLSQIKNMVKTTLDAFGRIDILVNSAGINRPTKATEVTEEIWDQIMDINLKGTFFCSQEVAKVMDKNRVSKIINISSQMAFVGYYDRAVYCASKGGIDTMTKCLAIEWAPNILVNSVAPTFIETSLTEGYFKSEEFSKDVISRIPLKRIGSPQDVVGAILYLASDLSNLVTGTSIKVDGGWTAW